MTENSRPTRICIEEGCDEFAIARGVCKKHYEHHRIRGTLPPLLTDRETRIPAGTRIGLWTVGKRADTKDHQYHCVCDCGTERLVFAGRLKAGKSQSCGCNRKPRVVEIDGRYGRLTIVAEDGRSKSNQRTYECLCDCGTTVHGVDSWNLKCGNSKSCGCIGMEKIIGNDYAKRHGYTGTPTHVTWSSMLNRCTNVNSLDYPNYGGRGIKVCERWNPEMGGSFENFLEDMGLRPEGKRPSGKAEYSLDRVNVNGNYEPSNCRWATIAEQNANRRPRFTLDVITEAAQSILEPEQVEALLTALGEYPQKV